MTALCATTTAAVGRPEIMWFLITWQTANWLSIRGVKLAVTAAVPCLQPEIKSSWAASCMGVVSKQAAATYPLEPVVCRSDCQCRSEEVTEGLRCLAGHVGHRKLGGEWLADPVCS